MKNNFQYYFYLKSEKYKQSYKHRFVLVTASLLLTIFILISVIFVIPVILNSQKKLNAFQIGIVCGILLPMLWILGYMIIRGIMSIRKVHDIFVTNKGINLPFPYDAKTKETFLKYDDIEKIVVYINPQNMLDSIIIFYLNKSIKSWIMFLPTNNKISLSSVNPYQFIEAIKRASKNRIPIEFKWWKELYKENS